MTPARDPKQFLGGSWDTQEAAALSLRGTVLFKKSAASAPLSKTCMLSNVSKMCHICVSVCVTLIFPNVFQSGFQMFPKVGLDGWLALVSWAGPAWMVDLV